MISKNQFNNPTKVFYILLMLMFGMSSTSSAQFKVYGIVKTENNKKYHGEVITYEPQQFVLMDCQGDTLNFDLDTNEFKFTTKKPPKPYIFPDGVGYHRISLGSLAGKPNDGAFVSYTYHYQKTRLLGYGGGLSFENYGDSEGYDFLVPRVAIFSYFREANSTPFVKADVGYGIAIKNTAKNQIVAQGGINFGAALGYRLSTNRVMIDFTIGPRFQQGNYEFDFGDYLKTENILFKRIDFGIGFMW